MFFEPRPLTNLEPIDRMESLCPILDMKVGGVLVLCVLGWDGGGLVGQRGSGLCISKRGRLQLDYVESP